MPRLGVLVPFGATALTNESLRREATLLAGAGIKVDCYSAELVTEATAARVELVIHHAAHQFGIAMPGLLAWHRIQEGDTPRTMLARALGIESAEEGRS